MLFLILITLSLPKIILSEIIKESNNNSLSGFYFNVLDFGAVGNASFDNTNAFLNAIRAAQDNIGGIVLVPAGKYLFSGNLYIPAGITLQGSYNTVPSSQLVDDPVLERIKGTALLPTAGKGQSTGPAFITLDKNANARGFVIFYIGQDPKPQGEPTPYPFAIELVGDNSAIQDIEILNPYQGIQVTANRHLVQRIQGQPLFMGIYIDNVQERGGRVEDVHFNPWWSCHINITNFQLTKGRAFIIAGAKDQILFNTFSFGYLIGYHVLKTQYGACNGHFIGIGADLNTQAAIQIEETAGSGLSVTNGEFTAFKDSNWCNICEDKVPTHVIVGSASSGSVRFINSAFWGPADRIGLIQGTDQSTTSFTDCTFDYWDNSKKNYSAFDVQAGNFLVSNSQFNDDKTQIVAKQQTKRIIITNNEMIGNIKIEIGLLVKSIVKNNVNGNSKIQNEQNNFNKRAFYNKYLENEGDIFNHKQKTDGKLKEVSQNYFVNVLDYGAKGDAQFDNTKSFQQAIDFLSGLKGGVVIVPSGKYLFKGVLILKQHVSLQGTYQASPQNVNPSLDKLFGSVLLPTAGENSLTEPAFINQEADTTIQGFVIFYPNQNPAPAGEPTPYPFTIQMFGNNPAILDGINATEAHRHYIIRIKGQPLFIGIYLDQVYDIGRIEDVQWFPWWSYDQNIIDFQLSKGIAFIFGRSDWEYVFNVYASCYKIAYKFIQTKDGGLNGNFLGIRSDLISSISVDVENSQPYGILITNGQFNTYLNGWCKSCSGFKPTHVNVGIENVGSTKFVNSIFGNQAYQIGKLDGVVKSKLSFTACTFLDWDSKNEGVYAIESVGGVLVVTGNTFQKNANQILAQNLTKKVLVTGNIFSGTQRISIDKSIKQSIVTDNLSDKQENQIIQIEEQKFLQQK